MVTFNRDKDRKDEFKTTKKTCMNMSTFQISLHYSTCLVLNPSLEKIYCNQVNREAILLNIYLLVADFTSSDAAILISKLFILSNYFHSLYFQSSVRL